LQRRWRTFFVTDCSLPVDPSRSKPAHFPVIVLNEAHLKRLLTRFLEYYHLARTHRALDNNAPVPRPVEPPELGKVIAIPQVGGLHHRYTRVA